MARSRYRLAVFHRSELLRALAVAKIFQYGRAPLRLNLRPGVRIHQRLKLPEPELKLARVRAFWENEQALKKEKEAKAQAEAEAAAKAAAIEAQKTDASATPKP